MWSNRIVWSVPGFHNDHMQRLALVPLQHATTSEENDTVSLCFGKENLQIYISISEASLI